MNEKNLFVHSTDKNAQKIVYNNTLPIGSSVRGNAILAAQLDTHATFGRSLVDHCSLGMFIQKRGDEEGR